MVILKDSLGVWHTDAFPALLKIEMERLRSDILPIAHLIGEGNRLDDTGLGIIVNVISDDATHIHVKVGVLFPRLFIA